MKEFTVHFHREDETDPMTIQKLSKDDYEQMATGGTRQLFELDTNFGYFLFLDGLDGEGKRFYFVLRFDEDAEEPADYYSFSLEDFFEMLALVLSSDYAEEDLEEGEEVFEPIDQLAHLLFHITDEGKAIE